MNILPDDPEWLGKKYFSNKYYSLPLPNSREVNQIIRETSLSIYIYIFFLHICQKFVCSHSEHQQNLYQRCLISPHFFIHRNTESSLYFHWLSRHHIGNDAKNSRNSEHFHFFEISLVIVDRSENTLVNEANSAIALMLEVAQESSCPRWCRS